MLIINILLLIIGCLILIKSSSLLITALTKIASYFRMSEFVIAFILMAFATSIPELFVGITSAIDNVPTLSLGSIIGSNIADLTLVIGAVAIFARGIDIKGKTLKSGSINALIIGILPILLMLDRTLSRIDGAILLAVFFIYVSFLFSQRKRFRKTESGVSKKIAIKNLILFLVGVVLLLISAWLVVKSSEGLAIELSIPEILIGLSIIAVGTSLPELVFEIKAIKAKRKEMVLGDLFGSIVANSALVLGIVALISPIEIHNFQVFLVSASFMVTAFIIFSIFIRTKDRLSWREGIFLIIYFIIFIISDFLFRG